jgi:hypothetical protein
MLTPRGEQDFHDLEFRVEKVHALFIDHANALDAARSVGCNQRECAIYTPNTVNE